MAQRYLGGIITANPVEPSENFSDSAASGMWTMQEALGFSKAGDWPDPTSINPSKFVENVFSTYVYTGDSSAGNETTGIDLVNNEGLIWFKWRSGSNAFGHALYDTVRGKTKQLQTQTTAAESTQSRFTGFREDGFSLSGDTEMDYTGEKYVAWTFRSQPKFFDIASYTGTGSGSNITISHNLGCEIGFAIIKRNDNGHNWYAMHRQSGNTLATQFGYLDNSNAFGSGSIITAASSSEVTFSSNNGFNTSGKEYVVYLFAHNNDDGGFGAIGDQDIIKCGSYTTDGNEDATINLGFETQWLLVKRSDASTGGDWRIIDNMRGWETDGDAAYVEANTSDAEAQSGDGRYYLTSTGFKQDNFGANRTYIYVAIRRGLIKVPTAGTDVLTILKEDSANLNQSPKYLQPSAFPVDFIINKVYAGGTSSWWSATRMTNARLQLESTAAESQVATTHEFDHMNGVAVTGLTGATTFMGYMFRRAPKFFDIVAYTGTGAIRTVTHNLGVTPEFMIIKARDATENWVVYHSALGSTKYLNINNNGTGGTTIIAWNNTDPTSSVFTTNVWNNVNGSGTDYIGYLFATLAGVSKVGTYSGTGSDVNVDCGFTNGARFVLAKRTDSTGSWYVWDSARGIVAGNDPYLLTDSVADHVTNTDYIDPLSSGFTITSNAGSDLNHNGGSYVFLAIA